MITSGLLIIFIAGGLQLAVSSLTLEPTMSTIPIPPNTNPIHPAPSGMAEVIEFGEVRSKWAEYESHLRTWFYNPDVEAARIVLAAAASHFHKSCDPCWLFILGPSSGDKTSICINSLLGLPNVHMKGELTAKTFLSGYTGTAYPSLLHQVGSGILAFKDFTTFMSKRPEEQGEIASQLREIYDGAFVKDTGKGVTIRWEGKMTVIAAATPRLEGAWATRRDLGERFLQVRISRKDGIQQSEFAQRQRGREEFISTTMKRLALSFFQCNPSIINPPPALSQGQMTRVAAMAELVSICRGAVIRHPITSAICDLPQIENSGRMSKSLAAIISNHAALFRRNEITEEDMAIGKRVALNTIPAMRSLLIDLIPISGTIGSAALQAKTGLPDSTIGAVVADLEALGVFKVSHNTVVENEISLNRGIIRLWNQAFDPLSLAPQPPAQPQ